MSLSLGFLKGKAGMTVDASLRTVGGLNVLIGGEWWVLSEAPLSCDGS